MGRGLGPARQSEAFAVDAVAALNLGMEPAVEGGPVFPGDLLVVGAFWVLREIEAAAIDMRDVSIDRTKKKATIMLTSSKTDIEAKESLALGGACAPSGRAPARFAASSGCTIAGKRPGQSTHRSLAHQEANALRKAGR